MAIKNGLTNGRDLEKRRKAIELWLKGLTYFEIGKAIKVSRQRAQQMISPPRPIWNAIRAKAGGKCQDCGVAVMSGHIHHKNSTGRTIDDFNDMQNLVYLCPGCHRRAHSEPRHGSMAFRPTDSDSRLMQDLQGKLKINKASVFRLALRRLAEAEGLQITG